MGWILFLLFAAATGLGLWRIGKLERSASGTGEFTEDHDAEEAPL